MKAIILAAGRGIRLAPLTDQKPKCMVEYKGKPIIDYTLETLRACGVSDIVIVKGYRAVALQRANVRFAVNPNYANTNMVETLFCVEDELNTDVIVSYGDIIYESQVLEKLLEYRGDFGVVVDHGWLELWQSRMENPLADVESMKINANGQIIELGKKPESLAEVQGQYIGLFKISAAVLPIVKDFYHKLDRRKSYDGRAFEQMYMTSFLQLIIDDLMPIDAIAINRGWLEIDCPKDLECELRNLS